MKNGYRCVGVTSERQAKREFDECRHLHVHGVLLGPDKIKAKTADLIFILEVGEVFSAAEHRSTPNGVGSLHVEKRCLVGHLEMPRDALDPVL